MCLYLKIAGMLWLVCWHSLHKTMVPFGGGLFNSATLGDVKRLWVGGCNCLLG